MWDGDCGSIPVRSEAGTPVGIVSDRDIPMAAALPHRTLREITKGKASDGRPGELQKQGLDRFRTPRSHAQPWTPLAGGRRWRAPAVIACRMSADTADPMTQAVSFGDRESDPRCHGADAGNPGSSDAFPRRLPQAATGLSWSRHGPYRRRFR